MKGQSSMFSTSASFALSSSKSKRGVFQQPARPFDLSLGLLKLPLLIGFLLLLALELIPDEGASQEPNHASYTSPGTSMSCGRADDSS
jgi:hypothetical protein